TGSIGAQYQLERALTLSGPWIPVDAPTLTFGVTNIIADSACVYRVGIWTNTPAYLADYANTSMDRNAPTTPVLVSLTAVSGSEVAFSWTASTDIGTLDGLVRT